MCSIYDDEFDMIVDDTIDEHIPKHGIQYIDITLIGRLKDYLSCNSIKKNIEIINEFGGVYKNLKKYNNVDMDNESGFYIDIALTAVKELLMQKLENKIDG